MRFFTNENKDDGTEAKDTDVKERGGHHSDSTDSSDTVALPQQRGNSPWSSTPDTDHAPDHTTDPGTDSADAHSTSTDSAGTHHTGTDSADVDSTGIHRRDDEPLIEDPTPPDHAVADTSPDAGPAGSGTAAVPHAPAAARTDTDGDTDADDDTDATTDGTTDGKGATLRDDGGFDDPKVVDPATDEPVTTEAAAIKDDGGFDDPKAVDPATEVPVTTAGAAVTEEPADAKPGEVPEPEITRIFGADDARAFQDRWRDVQLRFVDSPKEATAEAAALVDDAVEKLTASLRGQKDSFGGESTEDTEKLRVELRGYREIFNRIIGL